MRRTAPVSQPVDAAASHGFVIEFPG